MIQTIELQPGVTLRCFRDDRFKQGVLSLQYLRRLCPEEAALNALVPAVVRRHVGDKIQNSNSPAANSEERLRVLLCKLSSYRPNEKQDAETKASASCFWSR